MLLLLLLLLLILFFSILSLVIHKIHMTEINKNEIILTPDCGFRFCQKCFRTRLLLNPLVTLMVFNSKKALLPRARALVM